MSLQIHSSVSVFSEIIIFSRTIFLLTALLIIFLVIEIRGILNYVVLSGSCPVIYKAW